VGEAISQVAPSSPGPDVPELALTGSGDVPLMIEVGVGLVVAGLVLWILILRLGRRGQS
jgi:hypothetical protein